MEKETKNLKINSSKIDPYDRLIACHNKLNTGVTRKKMETIRQKVNEKLKKASDDFQYHPDLNNFFTEAHHILLNPNAKRIRSIIPVLIGELLSLDIENCLLNGVMIELLHFTSLIHDDVIDQHNSRRKHPTLNNTFIDKHAVLIGDYMLTEVVNCALRSDFNLEVIRYLIDAAKNLITGLIIEQDVMFADPSLGNYLKMANLKTGSLFALSFGLPFVGDSIMPLAMTCGEKFGLLFQIFDDYIDRDKDRPYENIFHIIPRDEILKLFDDNFSELLRMSREIGIEPVVIDIVEDLRSYGYFLSF